jgi:hypothetical protein
MNRVLKVYLILLGVAVLTGILGWSWLDWIQVPATIGFIALSAYFAFRFTRRIFRKFLWRIRRKLILSYIFIGFIPIFLLFVLTLLGFFHFYGPDHFRNVQF